jgi:hypothetical protein
MLKIVKDYPITKGMNLDQLMEKMGNNIHGESSIQLQTFKENSPTFSGNYLDLKLFKFLLTEKDSKDFEKINGKMILQKMGLRKFLEIVAQMDKAESERYYYESMTDPKMRGMATATLESKQIDELLSFNFRPEVKVSIDIKDQIRFYSDNRKLYDMNKQSSYIQYEKQENRINPRCYSYDSRRMNDNEFIAHNLAQEGKAIGNNANCFSGMRSLTEFKQLLEYFGENNNHKVIATNKQQKYSLIHKINIRVESPASSYFVYNPVISRTTIDKDLEVKIKVEIFHQYFLAGLNEEGGYFITAIIFRDPKMLFDLIRTQDFTEFLKWFNREDQNYQRIQGDLIYRRLKVGDYVDLRTLMDPDSNYKKGNAEMLQAIPLDLEYGDKIPVGIFHRDNDVKIRLAKHVIDEKIREMAKNYELADSQNYRQTLVTSDQLRIFKEEAEKETFENHFTISHHSVKAFSEYRKGALETQIKFHSIHRLNQYLVITGASSVILEHEQHITKAITVEQDEMIIISHQRGKDINNLFAD